MAGPDREYHLCQSIKRDIFFHRNYGCQVEQTKDHRTVIWEGFSESTESLSISLREVFISLKVLG
jgi:hypothetical protein